MSFRKPVSNNRDTGEPVVINDNGFDNARGRGRTHSIIPTGTTNTHTTSNTKPQITKEPTVNVISEDHDDDNDIPPPLSPQKQSEPQRQYSSSFFNSTLNTTTITSSQSTSTQQQPTSQPVQSTGLLYNSYQPSSSFRRPGQSNATNPDLTTTSTPQKSTTTSPSTTPIQNKQRLNLDEPPSPLIKPSIEDDDSDNPPEALDSFPNSTTTNNNSTTSPQAPKSSFFKRAFSRLSTLNSSSTTPSSSNDNNKSQPTPLTKQPSTSNLTTTPEDGIKSIDDYDCLPPTTHKYKNKDSFDIAQQDPVYLGSKRKPNNTNFSANLSTLFNQNAHRKSTDVVRIARVFIDPTILDNNTHVNNDENNNDSNNISFSTTTSSTTTPTTTSPQLQNRQSLRRMSFTGNNHKQQPICLTCHFRPTGDANLDRQQILQATLMKLHLSTESMLDGSNNNTSTTTSHGINIHHGNNNNNSSQNLNSSVAVVGGEDLLSLLNSKDSNTLLDDEINSKQFRSNSEENDSIVASFDEKPLLSSQGSKRNLLSRRFSLASLTGGNKDKEQQQQSPPSTTNQSLSSSTTTTTSNNVILTPITRQTFDPNSFSLVPYSSTTGKSDLSTLTPTQRRGVLQGNGITPTSVLEAETQLAQQQQQQNEQNSSTVVESQSSLRKMSLSTNGFILEYSLIKIDCTQLDFTTMSSNEITPTNQQHVTNTIHEDNEEIDHDIHDTSSSIPPPPPSTTNATNDDKRTSTQSIIPPPPSQQDNEFRNSISVTNLNHHHNQNNQSTHNKDSISSTTPQTQTVDDSTITTTSSSSQHRSDTTLQHSPSIEQSTKERDLFIKIVGSDGPIDGEKQQQQQHQQPPKPPYIQGSALPDFVHDISYIVTDTPVLHVDLVKVNKIKRKLPRTLTFTPSQLITSVTHKEDCHHEYLVQQITHSSRSQHDHDDDLMVSNSSNKDYPGSSTPGTPTNKGNKNIFGSSPNKHNDSHIRHKRNASTNSDLIALTSMQLNPQQSQVSPQTIPNNSPSSPAEPLNISSSATVDSNTTTTTTTTHQNTTPPQQQQSLNINPQLTQTPSEHSSSSSSSTLIPPLPPQGTLNPGLRPYLYQNDSPDQCPRCGQVTEKTFSCPLSEVLYASVVHIHSIRLCYLTRSSQLYLTDNAPLVATFINMYLSMIRQKNITSSLNDLNKIVATHRILATGAVRYIAVKMHALEHGQEQIELYNAQKITINQQLLVHSNFSSLGRKMVLTQYIPRVVNTQFLARHYPVIHQYIQSKGKNDISLIPSDNNNANNSDVNKAPSMANIAAGLLNTVDLAITSSSAADSIFNMFMTGGVSYLPQQMTQIGSSTHHQHQPSHLLSPNKHDTNNNTNNFHFGENSDDEGEPTPTSFTHHSLQFTQSDLASFNNNSLLININDIHTTPSTLQSNHLQYTLTSDNILVNTLRDANNLSTVANDPNLKLGSFLTNIRVDRSYIDQNNQFTPEVLQYLASAATAHIKDKEKQRHLISTSSTTTTTATTTNMNQSVTASSPSSTPTKSQLEPSYLPSSVQSNTSSQHLPSLNENATTTTQQQPQLNTNNNNNNNTKLHNGNIPLARETSLRDTLFGSVQSLPFLYLDSSLYNQLLGITISPNIWRMIIKIMLVCSQPQIFKTVINTIPLIHNNHHQIMLSWIKTYETYKAAYDKYYTDALSKNTRIQSTTVYQRNDVFNNNLTLGDDDFVQTNSTSTTSTAIQNALTVSEDIFDVQDPNHTFHTTYLSKSLKEQISKIDKEGGVLLYRTKQLTSALSQYVQQHHYDELCQLSIAPYTTIDSYSTTPDIYIKKPSIWQQLQEQMIKNQSEGKTNDSIEEPDYDTMVTHATQYAIELVITPPLTPLLDVYLSLKCHSKDYKLHQICLYHTTHKRKQSDYNIPIHLQSSDKWITAISAIKQITTVYTAIERLQCLLTCCKYIYHTYKLMIHTRQTAYNIVKQQVTNGFYINDLTGFPNANEIDLTLYKDITKIQSPNEFLINRIKEQPRKEYVSFRKHREIIEADIEHGKYEVYNRIPTVKEILNARWGIYVQLTEDINDIKSKVKNEFILIKDDIGPASSLCADDFFPIFVYVVMNAKITKLETIKQYIGSMAPRVSLTGEVGYYFTVFEAVIEYIDTLSPS